LSNVDELAHVTLDSFDDSYVATISGEIDMSNADEICRWLERSLVRDASRHVIDLSSTTYLDSGGVRMLFTIAERLRSRGRQLHIVVPEGAPIHRILMLVELSSRATMHDTLDAALR
jgi:anti-anti-sigma factor